MLTPGGFQHSAIHLKIRTGCANSVRIKTKGSITLSSMRGL